MSLKGALADAFLGSIAGLKIWEMVNRFSPERLTVLAYHRVLDTSSPTFTTYKPNVSASPAAFAWQMDYVQNHFNVINLDRLLQWLQGHEGIPERSLLITFDDGYLDNYVHAYPELLKRRLPALLFVTTGFVDHGEPFYWDRLAHAFHLTQKKSIDLAQFGHFEWSDAPGRGRALRKVLRHLKSLPDAESRRLTAEVLAALDVASELALQEALALDWGQIREMSANGIAIGGHTHTHPILTRIPLEQAKADIRACLSRIQAEIGQPARAFAYTNGLAGDFNAEHMRLLEEEGIQAAFSLLPGPTSFEEVRQHPFAIRRVMIHHRDHPARFQAKLGGLARLARDRL